MSNVLVTGASGGIGSAVADLLASSGHHVIGVGRDSGRLERLRGDGAGVVTADLAHVDDLRGAEISAIGSWSRLNNQNVGIQLRHRNSQRSRGAMRLGLPWSPRNLLSDSLPLCSSPG
jgi:NAD(P)-dependent dehydrogenase (short-subunit alcohol dehydrogenase family)